MASKRKKRPSSASVQKKRRASVYRPEIAPKNVARPSIAGKVATKLDLKRSHVEVISYKKGERLRDTETGKWVSRQAAAARLSRNPAVAGSRASRDLLRLAAARLSGKRKALAEARSLRRHDAKIEAEAKAEVRRARERAHARAKAGAKRTPEELPRKPVKPAKPAKPKAPTKAQLQAQVLALRGKVAFLKEEEAPVVEKVTPFSKRAGRIARGKFLRDLAANKEFLDKLAPLGGWDRPGTKFDSLKGGKRYSAGFSYRHTLFSAGKAQKEKYGYRDKKTGKWTSIAKTKVGDRIIIHDEEGLRKAGVFIRNRMIRHKKAAKALGIILKHYNLVWFPVAPPDTNFGYSRRVFTVQPDALLSFTGASGDVGSIDEAVNSFLSQIQTAQEQTPNEPFVIEGFNIHAYTD